MQTGAVNDSDPHQSHQHAAGASAPPFGEASWDERYRSSTSLWSGEANAQVVAEVADLAAGTALDAGCGEGGDAIWLASRGWQVTAVDISSVALERAAANALQSGDDVAHRITWVHADLAEYVPTPGTFNLVSSQFIHLPRAEREPLHARLAAAVAPGGVLLIVGHDISDLETTIRRPRLPELFASAPEMAASLPSEEWTTLVAEARPRPAVDPDGNAVTIHDAVMKAQRTRAT
jgi:SAM-dependent methyltransferase